jgi:hypothetical protein
MSRLQRRSALVQAALAAGAAVLFIDVLRRVPLEQTAAALQRLAPWQVAGLLALNLLIVLSFSARWWLMLAALGHRLPYVRLSAHRLAAFGVSYFTPGTQFGGEPLQVYLVSAEHAVPAGVALTAVTLDKALELLANFSFLAAGIATLLLAQGRSAPIILAGSAGHGALLFAGLLLALPAAFLAALWAGRRPVARLAALPGRLLGSPAAGRISWLTGPAAALAAVDAQSTALLRGRPAAVALALGVSVLSWLAMLAEYWLMAGFLGARLTLLQAIIALTAARVAFLLPLPGGLGALETSQALAFAALVAGAGADAASGAASGAGAGAASGAGAGAASGAALGLSLALLIRARDVCFGAAGLGWAGLRLSRLRSSPKGCKVAPHREPSHDQETPWASPNR